MFLELLYFCEIQNSTIIYACPTVKLYISSSDFKGDGKIPRSHFVKNYQLFRRILNYVSRLKKAPSLKF